MRFRVDALLWRRGLCTQAALFAKRFFGLCGDTGTDWLFGQDMGDNVGSGHGWHAWECGPRGGRRITGSQEPAAGAWPGKGDRWRRRPSLTRRASALSQLRFRVSALTSTKRQRVRQRKLTPDTHSLALRARMSVDPVNRSVHPKIKM